AAPPDNWVPTHDSAMNIPAAANPIGLQIHGGGDYWNRAGRGTWYRNIRIRPLDEQGNPIPVSLREAATRAPDHRLRLAGDALVGRFEGAHAVTVRDVSGRVYRRFVSDSGGEVRYALGNAHGVLIVEIRTARGLSRHRLGRM